MELHIQSEFDCVYSINGEFFERADSITMSEYDVVYVSVFPLKHSLLPYTVKLCGAENLKTELAYGIKLSSDHYLLILSPRHMIVYESSAKQTPAAGRISRLFSLVNSGNIDTAYAMLSDGLQRSIDKPTLESFFSGYERITECPWDKNGNKFYLIDKNGTAKLHSYTLKNEFIDDIVECDP